MSEQDLIQIIYISEADYKMSETALMEILQQARENNAARGISGMLVYNEGVFLQVLEGPKDEVEVLLDIILGDGRHSNFRILAETPIEKKEFEDWSMGFVDVSGMAHDVDGYVDFLQTLNDPEMDKNSAKGVLKRFQQGEWRQYASSN